MLQLFKNDAVTNANLIHGDVRQKELDFYVNNYVTLGGTSTVMAGFVFSQLTNPVPPSTNWILETIYLVSTALCLGLNLCIISWSTLSCIWGPGMALRGADGMHSMHQVLDFFKSELASMYFTFMTGIFMYFVSTCSLVWVYPSQSVVNWAMMVCFAIMLLAVIWFLIKLEMRLGIGIVAHEGPDGKIHGFGTLESVADLDGHLAGTNVGETMALMATHPGMY